MIHITIEQKYETKLKFIDCPCCERTTVYIKYHDKCCLKCNHTFFNLSALVGDDEMGSEEARIAYHTDNEF